jgi:hypothetical protein
MKFIIILHIVLMLRMSRDVRSQNSSTGEVKNFLFSTSSIKVLGFTPATYPMGTGARSPGIK